MAEIHKSILYLPEYIEELPSLQRNAFGTVYRVSRSEAPMHFKSDDVRQYLAQRFRVPPEDMDSRRSVRVQNIVLDEEALFNPMRLKRPMGVSKDDNLNDLRKSNPIDGCDLCNIEDSAPMDPFGRIKGEYSVSAANAGAYDALHSLIVPVGIHNPCDLTEDVLKDMIHTASSWLMEANKFNPKATFPAMGINILPKAGASLFHPHLQVLLAEDDPYRKIEDLRRRMMDHQLWNGYSYSTSLTMATEGLGLVFDHGSSHTIFNLTPRKEGEVWIWSDDSVLPNGDLSAAIYRMIEWRRIAFGSTSYNMVIFMPPLGEDIKLGKWHDFHPFVRLVDRGKEGVPTSDMGFMEIYLSPVIGSDPLRLADMYREYLLTKESTPQSVSAVI